MEMEGVEEEAEEEGLGRGARIGALLGTWRFININIERSTVGSMAAYFPSNIL